MNGRAVITAVAFKTKDIRFLKELSVSTSHASLTLGQECSIRDYVFSEMSVVGEWVETWETFNLSLTTQI